MKAPTGSTVGPVGRSVRLHKNTNEEDLRR